TKAPATKAPATKAPATKAPATEIDEDDWDDDFLTDDFLTLDPPSSSSDSSPKDTIPVREKPSLLTTPVILAGWVKDVVKSFTQPKPSKPVIEIPRRDSPSINKNLAVVKTPKTEPSVNPARPAPEPPSEPTFTPPKANEPDFDTSDSNEQYFDTSNSNEQYFDEPPTETKNNWEESNWDD
ncbi:MAG: hypothetical protein AAGM27_07255, partial [Cyanobacteria bacterium J06554_3]